MGCRAMHELRASILGFDPKGPRLEKNGDRERYARLEGPDPDTKSSGAEDELITGPRQAFPASSGS
jgi:hypothetical protein